MFNLRMLAGLSVIAVMGTGAHASWQKVAGEWEKYHLNDSQMQWFNGVRSKTNFPCCSVADGHPTEMQHRLDGYYIPDPRDTTAPWVKIPEQAMTTPGTNPVGVATVWYVIQGDELWIRCFVPEAET